jgi:hypothetical protein
MIETVNLTQNYFKQLCGAKKRALLGENKKVRKGKK